MPMTIAKGDYSSLAINTCATSYRAGSPECASNPGIQYTGNRVCFIVPHARALSSSIFKAV